MPTPPDDPKGLAAVHALNDWATELLKAGRKDAARRLFTMAAECIGLVEGLAEAESSASLQPVTGVQLQRRGKAIAKAHAAKSKDRLWQAIVASKWGSQERYARERLKVSPGSLSAYRSGATPCPRPVAAKVLADFGIGEDYWPADVVD